jgi:hypothetical protein
MLTFDNFKNLFHRAKKTQWILYKGASKGQQIGSMLSEGEIDVEESLSELQDIVTSYGDGVYTVECRSSRAASRGNDIHTFMYGDAAPVTQVSGKGTAAAPVHPAASFFSGLDAKYFMDQTNDVRNQLQQAQMKLLQKEMEIINLKRDLKESEKEPDAGIGSFLSKNPQIVERAIGFLSGDQPRAAVGTLKATKPITIEDNEVDEEYEYEPGKIDLNALFEAAMRLQAALPDIHPNDVFDKIAEYAETNPAQAKNLLSMI